ncbi:hypothetical protein SLEP1_g44931 [Rubroshorea leprosula]|uniref:Protein argonaute 2-like n=2 Tax=Rubroshorea leprosula TaxID=152421 RepID=A0AAV5LHS0_9ROSI|nr:hypothetical protein SLEP1_g44931 [Rubroshorea leprosula]
MERGGVGSGGGRGRGGGGGRGRGRGADHHHNQQQRQQQWQSGRGSSQGRSQGHVGPSQSGSQKSHVGSGYHSGSGGGIGSWGSGSGWGRGASFAQVVSQRPPVFPQQAPDPVVTEMQSLTLSQHAPPSSSSPENIGRLVPIKRSDVGTNAMRKVSLRANHFPINFMAEKMIWHYDVDIKLQRPHGNGRPPKKPQFNLSMIRNKLSLDDPINFPLEMTAYDGKKNLFSVVELPTGEFTVKLFEVSYVVSLKLVNELKFSKDYLSGTGKVLSVPRDILQAMDLAMKENPKRYATQFSHQGDDLGRGIIACREPRYRLKPTSHCLALVLDYSVLPFTKPIPVIDFLKQYIYGFNINEFHRFADQVKEALKELKVYRTYLQSKQRNVIAGLANSARQISFTITDLKGNAPPRDVLLVDYFRDKYNLEIRYKDIPCLDLGRNNYVPLEFCVIAERQRYPKENLDKNAEKKLRELSLAPAKVREKIICELVRAKDGPCGGGIAQNFGIAVDMNMTKVTGRVISPPELKVGVPGGRWTRIQLNNEKCDWNLVQKHVVEGKLIERWAVLDFTCSEFNCHQFITKLNGRCETLGIHMKEPLLYQAAAMSQLNNVNKISELLEGIKDRSYHKGKGHLQFILCVMATQHPGYKYLKWISETRVGIITQCCLSTNKMNDQYLALLAININAKLGGSNVELLRPLPGFESKGHVMFVGADVNHPGSKNSTNPSIAAVTASMNWPAANHYAARVRPQDPRTEKIQDFKEMCLEHLEAYVKLNKVRPDKIMIFRDGVSEGQFDMVLNEELSGLKGAFRSMNYFPTITLVVAQKRHLTRFFPETKEDGNSKGNVPTGTVVDTIVDDFSRFNFYLCSHFGSIGTSKPTHYQVLWDEHGFTSDGIQQLIYSMCFTSAQCTKPISLIPPVYYADLAAYRGRLYQEALMDWHSRASPASSSSSSSQSNTAAFDKGLYKLCANLENAMFFI